MELAVNVVELTSMIIATASVIAYVLSLMMRSVLEYGMTMMMIAPGVGRRLIWDLRGRVRSVWDLSSSFAEHKVSWDE